MQTPHPPTSEFLFSSSGWAKIGMLQQQIPWTFLEEDVHRPCLEDHCYAKGTSNTRMGDQSLFRGGVRRHFTAKAIHSSWSGKVNRPMERKADVPRHSCDQHRLSFPFPHFWEWSLGGDEFTESNVPRTPGHPWWLVLIVSLTQCRVTWKRSLFEDLR